MALRQHRLVTGTWGWVRGEVGIRFVRFAGVAVASLATSEILLVACDSLFHLTAVPAALIATMGGAVVSYVLSRWAWERKGKPDVLRETMPFWVVSILVWVALTLATKLGYHLASWMHLHGFRHALLVGGVYFVANCVTFILRFLFFHYVLFTDRTAAGRTVADQTVPDRGVPASGTSSAAEQRPGSLT